MAVATDRSAYRERRIFADWMRRPRPQQHIDDASFCSRRYLARMSLTPCVLERKVLPKVWGGRGLTRSLGLALPPDEDIGETWEAYDRPDGSSAIRGSDRTLRDLMLASPEALLGAGVQPTPQGYFPLLIKYIDARTALSVQVHPDDEAARVENDMGKTEAWVVLDRGEDARIIRGLKPGVTLDMFAKVAHTAAVEELLWDFVPEIGDTVFVPPGTVHAIGPDVVVYEVQQNSDVTYRLYDWGRPRETQPEKALKVVALDHEIFEDRPVVSPTPIDERSTWLVRNEHFRLRRIVCRDATTLSTEGSVKVASLVRGNCTLGWHSGGEDPPLILRSGDTALIPGCIDSVFVSPIGTAEFLWADAGGAL